MMQLIGSGLPFFGIGMRFLMWLYFVPMVLFFIGTGFARECLVACLKGQFKSARFNAKQSVFGFIASGLAFSLIFYREDAFRCVVSLF